MRRHPWAPALLVWVLTRAIGVVLLMTVERLVSGDLHYFERSLDALGSQGVDRTLIEYPVPGVGLLLIPHLAVDSLGMPARFPLAIAAVMLTIDLALMLLLLRARPHAVNGSARWGILPAEWMWLLAIPAIGGTAYGRFDLAPGMLVGAAVLYAARRPAFAGLLASVATAIKYWPAIVLPGLLAPRRGRWPMFGGIVAGGLVLAVASLVASDQARLLSPFTWQSDRGLQIESVPASPAMLGWAMSSDPSWTVSLRFHAWEIAGPWTDGLELLSKIATVLLIVVLAHLWWRSWRSSSAHSLDERGRQNLDVLVWAVLAAITGYIAVSKVFSPQYLLWILPAAAAGLVVVRDQRSWRRLALWCGGLLLASAITQVFFPLHYGPLLSHSPLSMPWVSLLTIRNLIVVCLAIGAVIETARLARGRSAAPLGSQPSRHHAEQIPPAAGATT